MNMTVGGPGGNFGNMPIDQGPGPREVKGFKNDIKNDSTEDLAKGLMDKNTEPWKKQAMLEELLERLAKLLKEEGDKMSPEEKDGLEELAKDLQGKGANGKGSGELIGKLLEALGIPKQIADGVAQALDGGGGGGPAPDSSDIQ